MATPWILRRVSDGWEYELSDGEHTIGRNQIHNIVIPNQCVSRSHSVITVDPSGLITIEDKKTPNGTYVGTTKIPREKPYPLTDGDIIGFGCTNSLKVKDVHLDDIVFQLVECIKEEIPTKMKLKFIEDMASDVSESSFSHADHPNEYSDLVDLVSESDLESLPDVCGLNIKTEDKVTMEANNISNHLKIDKIETMEAFEDGPQFTLKEEYNVDDDIECLSDSEDDVWAVRLSQSSPGKPLRRNNVIKISDHSEESADSDLDIITPINMQSVDTTDAPHDYQANKGVAFHTDDDEVFSEDLICIPDIEEQMGNLHESQPREDLTHENILAIPEMHHKPQESNQQTIVSLSSDGNKSKSRKAVMITPMAQKQENKSRIISNLKRRISGKDSKTISPKRRRKVGRSKTITTPPKPDYREDRSRRLREIAEKEKAEKVTGDTLLTSPKTLPATVKTKSANSSRGNFLIESAESCKTTHVSKTSKSVDKSGGRISCEAVSDLQISEHKELNKADERVHDEKSKKEEKSTLDDSKKTDKSKPDRQNKSSLDVSIEDEPRPDKSKDHSNRSKKAKSDEKPKKQRENVAKDKKESKRSEHRERSTVHQESSQTETISQISNKIKRLPLKDVVPLTNIPVGIPVSKVQPTNRTKAKKNVCFSADLFTIKEFQIEEGNRMKKTSELKVTQMHALPPRTYEQQLLAHILRWSTKWLEEQINMNKPPPILPHNKEPMSVCHAIASFNQYARIISDLLLMEVWESVTQNYMKKRAQPYSLQLRLEAPPLVYEDKMKSGVTPTALSVNLSLPKNVPPPRMGELMLVTCEPAEDRTRSNLFRHPFYVHNVRVLPAPRNNVNQFYSITLQTVNTHMLRHLQPGAPMLGKPLAFIKNELVLMEAVEELRWSPLAPLVLRPQPEHFRRADCGEQRCRWTMDLNASQLQAVESSVSAALGTEPSLQMIQGPPGTGKSSVICSTVMRYFYGEGGRLPGRGKVLICATSNAAVDELVVRLLKIRQTLPSESRFRMVRVGREESMHPRALDVSSGRLAEKHVRAHRAAGQPQPAGQPACQEINWLEGKLNSVNNQLQMERSKNPAAVPALEKRRADYIRRIEQFRTACNMGASVEPTREEKADAERRVIDGSDIVVTTLASVANNKLKCLKGRIALCIVDEAGQAIEPETLIPLTLQVTKMTLIGDPRQLPGFINSQRAKKHGLGESMFSRLSTTAEEWPRSPVILLDVQYRMHPAIADYPNRAFYGGLVRDRATRRGDLPLPAYRMLFVSGQGQGESCSNETEAWGVARLVSELWHVTRVRQMSLAVITPYNAQKDLIKRCLAGLMDKESGCVEVNTVDSFQGQERDVVVVSLARSQGVGFLTDPGRINVMLTRAKHSLLVCLNPHALLSNNQWRSLIDDARKRSAFVDLPSRVCRPATAEAARADPVLAYLHK